ncbi:hypothetical protein Tco_0051657 [Tanacetum coccineum]
MGILSGRSIGARCFPKPALIPVGDLIRATLRAHCSTKYTSMVLDHISNIMGPGPIGQSSTQRTKTKPRLTGYGPEAKVQQEKLKAVKARLHFEETSRHSESGTPIKRRGLKERLGPRYVRSKSRSPEPRHDRPESPKKKGPEKKAVFKRLEKGVFYRLEDKGKSVFVHSNDSRHWSHHSSRRDTESCHQSSRSRAIRSAPKRRYNKRASSRRTEELSESESSAGGHWKSKLKSHIKTYDKSEDPEDHLKIFQSATKTERWAMPTWCHVFNSTLNGNARVWFDDLPKEIIDSYDDLKKAFLENYL